MAKFIGDENANYIEGTKHDDIIFGRGGGDTIGDLTPIAHFDFRHPSDDRFFGNGGDDYIFSKTGNDILNGGPGDDLLHISGTFSNTVIGGSGDDILRIAIGAKKDFELVTQDGSHLVYEHDGDTIDIRGVEHIYWTH
jgi:Ca2+-binding RTX toxin-like protein